MEDCVTELNKEQQKKLLSLARQTIREYSDNEQLPEPDFKIDFNDEIFKEKRGAFVTIHKNGKLRGCIGYIRGMKNIPETIVEMSRAAGFNDPRFPPLTRGEVDEIDIEISILSPIVPVEDIDEIEVGRDGLIISNSFRSGLLLPQVAREYGWSENQFLENTCYKAGLPADAWKWNDTKIERFSAQVFSEEDLV